MEFDNFENLEDFEITHEEALEVSQKFSASVCTFIDDEGKYIIFQNFNR